MNSQIKNSIEKGNLILLLGAGATKSSRRSNGEKLFTGKELAKFLSDSLGEPYEDSDTLGTVYASLKSTREAELCRILEQELMHCTPSNESILIAKFPWKRIYTLNIDDAFDVALRNSPQQVVTHRLKSHVKDHDQSYARLDYIKLNGSVDYIPDGLIFSPKEYAKNNITLTPWYEQLARDFFSAHFLFIGSDINEPSFEYVVELYAGRNKSHPGISHVLVPKMSKHRETQLREYGIQFIPGYLEEFSIWLEANFPTGLTQSTLAYANNPALADVLTALKPIAKIDIPKWANSVLQVGRGCFASLSPKRRAGEEHPFYKGFKPSWADIREGVPASTVAMREFHKFTQDNIDSNNQLIIALGQAGSGKTTALMNAAYEISKNDDIPVFYIQYHDELKEIIRTLNSSIKSKFIICIDRVYPYIKEISELFYDNEIGNCYIVTAERKNDWARRSLHQLNKYAKTYDIDSLTEEDAEEIINKIKEYGRWSRLAKLSPKGRIKEFMEKAKRQILIALLEVTRGEGFEDIINADYANINNDDEYAILHLVGLATVNNVVMPSSIAESAFIKMTNSDCFYSSVNNLHGIIQENRGKLTARHPLYMEHIFKNNANTHILQNSIISIIDSFLIYDVPFAFNLNKNDYTLYKSIINHSFLRRALKSESLIVDVYKSFERPIYSDGHFWLQYGLALRGFQKHEDAYDKLLQSLDIYKQSFTVHAVAFQEIILSSEAQNETKSRDLFASAKIRLESIDGVNRSDTEDHYPIVTLSEAHVKHLERFDGVDKAKECAAFYANDIFERNRNRKNKKLTDAWVRLTKYATSGIWTGKTLISID